ncbi:MAG: PDZ domain-containing protein [Anaerolineae bacterium]|nr:PDZ domain-containing protein [Anaerolineae bacterium]
MKKIRLLVGLLVIVMVTLACSFSTNLSDLVQPTAAAPITPLATATRSAAVTPVVVGDLQEFSDTLINLYNSTNSGVVSIQTYNSQGGGQGSGFVYDTDGHIITNYHVVEGADDLEVDFPSGLKVRGTVIGTDLDSDLAVIQVNVAPEALFPLPLGDSDNLNVGQTVVAIGNPFGLDGTMTLGIISAKGRSLTSLRTDEEGGYFSAGDIIQTDASINPGNSGGPLINLNGEVIGVNRAIRTTGVTAEGDPVNSGIGFAISSNIVRRVVPYLIETGSYDYPYLGIRPYDDASLLIRESLGIERTTGAYIVEVVAGSPADKAGLLGGSRTTDIPGLLAGGDLIVGVDGRPVRVFDDVIAYIMTNKSPGDTMIVTIVRDNVEQEVTITLGKRP